MSASAIIWKWAHICYRDIIDPVVPLGAREPDWPMVCMYKLYPVRCILWVLNHKGSIMRRKRFVRSSIATCVALTSVIPATLLAAPGRGIAQDQATPPDAQETAVTTLSTPTSPTGTTAAEPTASKVRTTAAEKKAARAAVKLEAAKLRSCQAREGALIKRSTGMTTRASNMMQKFQSIATKVETYYDGTVKPDGKTLANYAELKADIDAKALAVTAAVEAAKTNLAEFSCDGNDPKSVMADYRDSMQATNKALKEYRTAIKNLIQAIHKLNGDSDTAAASPATAPATPTVSTAVTPTEAATAPAAAE